MNKRGRQRGRSYDRHTWRLQRGMQARGEQQAHVSSSEASPPESRLTPLPGGGRHNSASAACKLAAASRRARMSIASPGAARVQAVPSWSYGASRTAAGAVPAAAATRWRFSAASASPSARSPRGSTRSGCAAHSCVDRMCRKRRNAGPAASGARPLSRLHPHHDVNPYLTAVHNPDKLVSQNPQT